MRVQEYLDSIHENEHRRVNRFLKGLGEVVSELFLARVSLLWGNKLCIYCTVYCGLILTLKPSFPLLQETK